MFENQDYVKGKPISIDDEKMSLDFQHAGTVATSGEPKLVEESVEQDMPILSEVRCGGPVPGLEVLHAEEMSVQDVVNEACRRLDAYLTGILE
jgi:hypothetical protein